MDEPKDEIKEQVVEQKTEVQKPADEEVKALREQLDKEKAERERWEKNYKTIQQTLSRKDQEAKKQSEPPNLAVLKRMAAALEKSLPSGEFQDEHSKQARVELQNIKGEIEQEELRQHTSRINSVRDDLQERIRAVGLDPDPTSPNYDDRLDTVVDAFQMQDYPLAKTRLDRILSKIEKEKKPVAEVKKEEPKKVDETELEKQIRARILKEYNLTNQESGGPSASSSSKDDANAKYSRGEISRDEYEKAMGIL